MSPSAPAHPMLAALETRLYGAATWRPASPADIASSLVDLVAELLAPSHVGNSMAHGSPAARAVASDALHSMARAQVGAQERDTRGVQWVWVEVGFAKCALRAGARVSGWRSHVGACVCVVGDTMRLWRPARWPTTHCTPWRAHM